ncbi:hypothetical protein RHGRI_023001 [Rhododendron griersonianum]|uniref:F-box domain-containing protein n=1 Tax=Rhododendron griersonianum TaxID=479676 RepID=A0AAV6J3X4_9ERIC|nr:hypothetical protein RHGRI_023001 [Rhododendron griersonianum]
MSRRRTKTPLYSGVDRISELPDPILVHILSLLPIKQAIRTEFLSTRWKSLWTCTPTLIFREFSCGPDCLAQNSDGDIDYDCDEEKCSRFEEGKFVTFVDKTLSLSNCSRVKKKGSFFRIQTLFCFQCRFVVSIRGREGNRGGSLRIPRRRVSVGQEGSLRVATAFVHEFGDVKLSDDLVQKILSGCPALEMLELYRYDGFSRLNIDNASLKKLILRKFVGRTYEEDEAYGEDDPQVDEADGEDNPQVDEANGEADGPEVDEADGPEVDEADGEDDPEVADWQHGPEEDEAAASTTVDGGDVQDFDRIQAEFRGLLSSFVHLKSLAVGEWALQYFWIQQAKLCNFKEEHYWTSQKRIFKCLSLHLKNVVFADSSWLQVYGFESNFFDLVQFLLKNAKVLQKIIINTSRLEDVMPKEFFRASKKILSFPRSSPEAVVLFS